jgi:hypothetical protein
MPVPDYRIEKIKNFRRLCELMFGFVTAVNLLCLRGLVRVWQFPQTVATLRRLSHFPAALFQRKRVAAEFPDAALRK